MSKSHKSAEDTDKDETKVLETTEPKNKEAAEGRDINPGAAESPKADAHPTSEDKSGPKPEKSAGVQVYDIESHKLTELFKSSDVVFVRENGAMELYPLPAHEAKTRFIEVDGKVESQFRNSTEVKFFKLKGGKTVTQEGHKTTIVDADGRPSTAGPTLHIHDTAVQA